MDVNSKEGRVVRFGQIERDDSLDVAAKRHQKDVLMLETFLEIRDLLRDIKTAPAKK